MKLRALITAIPIIAILGAAGSAQAAGDPVATGTFQLQVNGSVKKQLKKAHASVKSSTLTIQQGSFDPTTGQGELTLGGQVQFKRGHRKMSFGKLTATLGPNGELLSNKQPLFSLGGGSLARDGLGAQLDGVKLSLQKSAARVINRKLKLRSLRSGRAGSLAVSEQPQTVQLAGGSVKVAPYLSNVAGSVAAKLKYHCISPLGVTSTGAAIEPGGFLTPFYFPISGGTISPDGGVGLIQQSGGLEIANMHGDSGDGLVNKCKGSGAPLLAQLDEFDFVFDLKQDTVKSHVVISNRVQQPSGDQGTVVQANLDTSSLQVSIDPDNHTAMATGGVIRINAGTALYLNQVFPQPPSVADPSKEFAAGDLFAAADVTANVR